MAHPPFPSPRLWRLMFFHDPPFPPPRSFFFLFFNTEIPEGPPLERSRAPSFIDQVTPGFFFLDSTGIFFFSLPQQVRSPPPIPAVLPVEVSEIPLLPPPLSRKLRCNDDSGFADDESTGMAGYKSRSNLEGISTDPEAKTFTSCFG